MATDYRRRGIASAVIEQLVNEIPGQHIGLQTDSAQQLYASLGFGAQPEFWSLVAGTCLDNDADR